MAFVTVFSVIERFLGFIYRIYLSRTILDEGMGIYQIALTIFGLFLTITCSGIPITVSRMMTRFRTNKDEKSIHSTVTAGVVFSLLVSIPIVLIFFLFKDKLSFIFSDARSLNAFMIVLPGLIITSVYAVIRGSFWGNKDFVPYSMIELSEEAVMLVAGVVLINKATSPMDGVTRAAWAVVISYIFSFVTSLSLYLIKGGRFKSPLRTLNPLVSSSLPITGMRTATSLVNSLIASILPAKLIASGLSQASALSQFGAAFGMAIPILFMPGTLIGSLAVVLVPELSESYYKSQTNTLKRNVERALKFSVLIAGFIFPILLSYGKELGVFFYNSSTAGSYLCFASVIVIPMSICMITTSMLNSMNMEKRTLLYYSAGAAFMIASILILPSFCGIYALFIGLMGQFTITAILNLFALHKKITKKLCYIAFSAKCIALSIPSIAIGTMLKKVLILYLPNSLTCIIGCLVVTAFSACSYLLCDIINLNQIKKIK